MVFLFIFVLLTIVIYFSKIRLQIINFKFSSVSKRHINKNYKLVISWHILGKIPILKINITKTKLEKLKLKQKIKEFDLKIIQNNKKFDVKLLKALKHLNMQIDRFKMNLEIGTENAAITSIIVPIISTVVAIILQKKMKDYKNQFFMIKPIYLNQNLLNISFSGIFEIKINHIINIIYILNKKGEDKYERTSNRRAYEYSYEQH